MKEITLVVDEKWLDAIKNLVNVDIYEGEVCEWRNIKTVDYSYVFVCDPELCDLKIVATPNQNFDFPNGEIAMKCPCGRQMNYISKEYK